MKQIKCLIVDDEIISRKFLERYIAQSPDLMLVKSCQTAAQALAVLRTASIDLIFLDIEMPEMTGMQMLDEMTRRPVVIMVTGKEKYALKAFEYDALDYLMKPISFARFEKAVQKAIKALAQRPDQSVPEEMFIKVSSKILKVRFDTILFIEAKGDYAQLHTTERKHTIYTSMNEMLEKLPAGEFCRVHRSFIINISRVDGISRNEIQIGEHRIPIGVSFRKDFLARFKR
jgi:DNA-binding LytR/AlgR family response regulator